MRYSASSLLKALIKVLKGGAPFPGEPHPDHYLTSWLEWRNLNADRAYMGSLPPVEHVLAPLLRSSADRHDRSTVQSAALWTRHLTVLKPTLDLLALRGLRVWAWKGFDYALSLYPSPGDRPMFDIDLLVEPQFLDSVLETVSDSNWRPGSDQPLDLFRQGALSEYKLYLNGVRLELHTHPFYFPSTFPGHLPSDLYESGRILMPGLMGLRWEYALLLSLLHQSQQTSSKQTMWLEEYLMAELISTRDGWQVFEKASLETGLDRENRGILSVLDTLQDSSIPKRLCRPLEDAGSRNRILEMLRAGNGMPTLAALITLNWRLRLSYIHMLLAKISGTPSREEDRR